ncbi:Transcriptional regulator, GntR family domain / Aspartate aminotransferase [Cystobacter fuscus DSM 2262]|uniref:Transcriptional regulator, GntR family domain / Aspartate aminotransferase n=1 Tax=Cystobacter fuscus (strain ATCC 25194 / DSM 2262 / NBRC 100088 / M29) TaxID=1242864 RepID=S9R4X1_CYSF2|nr:Transcriptional regulator, GntR family domain / Aspartate aminotransferase [Cystobacter fuscus DSM 2262]
MGLQPSSSVPIVTETSWTPGLEGRRGPLYRVIADALAEDRDAGRLLPGTRLPTHRELAERLGVTVGTVTRAYGEAEKRGLVRGEVGRGTYVRDKASPTHMPRPVEEGSAEEGSLVELSINAPATPEGDPASQALRASLEELGRSPRLAELLAYQPPAGGLRHREAGAAWTGRFGLSVRPEQVVVCAGGQHGMEVALAALTQPGDVLATEALTYPGIKVLARRFQLRMQGLAMDADGLLPDALEAACRAGSVRLLYLQPTCHNPTGAVMPEARRREVAEVARRHGVLVLEDDSYGLLPSVRPPPLACFLPESSYFIAGVSKLLTPGLRIGYLVGPARARCERLAEEVGLASLMTTPLMAEVLSRWVEDGTADALVVAQRREAGERQALAREVLGAGVRCRASVPLYHLWLGLPEGRRSEAFTAQARRHGVSVTSADLFGVGPGVVPAAVRVCIGTPRTRALLERGLRRLREVLDAGNEPLAVV